MAKPPRWMSTLQAAREEAALAANLYNDSSETRSFEGFVVHMHLAWLYQLHAEFIRDDVDYRYWSRVNPKRLERVDGEVKRWELAKCVKQRWPEESDFIRLNLEFFVLLRNKIEHRHSRFDEYLAISVAGKAQSLLLNFENEITSSFGEAYSMANVLRFPVFIGTFTEEGTKTLKELRDRLPKDLQRFIADFHCGLPDGAEDDPTFELRLKVVLETARRDPDALTMKFVYLDDMTQEEREMVQKLGRDGRTVIREKTIRVAGAGLFRASDVVNQVSGRVPFVFNMRHATQAWKTQGIRPETLSTHPERTHENYCIYDALARTYGYTEAWVKRVIRYCQTAQGFEEFTGCEAKPLPVDESAGVRILISDELINDSASIGSSCEHDPIHEPLSAGVSHSTPPIVEETVPPVPE